MFSEAMRFIESNLVNRKLIWNVNAAKGVISVSSKDGERPLNDTSKMMISNYLRGASMGLYQTVFE